MTSNAGASVAVTGHSPFETDPGFYLDDNRKNRSNNRVTREVLEAKLSVLLPPRLVAGKSVLDLGACLGAAGHWALSHGATRYVGVELQADYAQPAARLLDRWSDRARIEQCDIRSYLAQAGNASFDVVLCMGVLYLFPDPEQMVQEICRVTAHTVAVESNFPRLAGAPASFFEDSAFVAYFLNQEVNLANANCSLQGLAATPSPAALDLFFRRAGFASGEGLLTYPRLADSDVYSIEARQRHGAVARFGIRYLRLPVSTAMPTLEENLPLSKGSKRFWLKEGHFGGATSIGTIAHHQATSDAQNGALGPADAATEVKWKFDRDVALDFERIAETSIPNYAVVIDKCVAAVRQLNIRDPRIIDVGSAVGTTLKHLHDAGFQRLWGVDSSPAMVEQSFQQATLICSDRFPKGSGPFDVVLANWVLHFVSNRENYLKDIADSLTDDGLLILSEKVQSSALSHELYHELKRSNGLSEGEISRKQVQLEGVLVQFPLTWYLSLLPKLGFEQIEIIDAHFSFVTIMARKAPTPRVS